MAPNLGLARSARLGAASAVALIVVAGLSASAFSSAVPASPPLPPPSRVIDAGYCWPPDVERCSQVGVARWIDVAFTPPVVCDVLTDTRCQLRMDITAPTSGGPWPLIVYLSGGPEASANDRSGLGTSPFVTALAGQGAVVITPAWRQTAASGGGWPTSFQDVACAIGVARSIGPAYGANPDRLTLGGHSLGAWPAAVLALTPSPLTPEPGACNPTAGSLRPDAVVISDGKPDEVVTMSDGAQYLDDFFGGDRAARPDDWADADPFELVKRSTPVRDGIEFLMIYGDTTRNVTSVPMAFEDALQAAGYTVSSDRILNGGQVAAFPDGHAIGLIIDIATDTPFMTSGK